MDFPEQFHRDRLCHLYSENAATEEETIEFWSRVLTAYCGKKQSPRFTIKEIVQQFTKSGVIPAYFYLSLQILQNKTVVVDELCLRNSRKSEETVLSNLITTLWSTIWSLNGSTNKITETSTESFILLSMLEEMNQMVLYFASLKEPQDLFFYNSNHATSPHTFAAFIQQFTQSTLTQSQPNSHTELNADTIQALLKLTKPPIATVTTSPLKSPTTSTATTDISILIDYMLRQKAMRISENEEILQVVHPQARSDSTYSLPLNDDNPHINHLHLRSSLHQLTEQLHTLQEKIRFYETKAKHAKCVAHNTSQALQYLHLKRLCLKQETCLYTAQYKLQETLQTVESTRMHVNIVEAYRIATKGLNSYRKAHEITIEKVEDAMDAFHEELETMQEISKVSMQQQQLFSVEEEKEMEDELQALFAEAEKTESIVTPTTTLPSVPTTPVRPVTTSNTQSPAQPTFSPP